MINDNIKNIAMISPISSFGGYGQYGRSVARMIINLYKDDQNINLFLFDSHGGLKEESFQLFGSKYDILINHIKPLDMLDKQFFDIFINVSIPSGFIQKGTHNIGITALAQVNKIHHSLIQHCNRMDQIWVMTDYNVNSINNSIFNYEGQNKESRELKINVPVKTLPYAVNKDDVDIKITQISDFLDNIQQEYLFLNVGQWLPGSIGNDRKDIGALILTFLSTFPNSKQVGLVLKTEQGRSGILSEYNLKQNVRQIIEQVDRSGVEKIENVNIYIISGNLSQEQMVELYTHKKIKTFVSFTHGESFGIPIMEFSLFGQKPLLIPYHSGMIDYIEPQNIQILVHKQTTVPQELFNTFYRQFMVPDSKWYSVDYKYASFKLKQMVQNYDKYLKRSKDQSNFIENNFNIQIISQKLKENLFNNNDNIEDDNVI